MTKTEQAATVEQVAFADLYISDLNPRTIIDPASIEALAANIRELTLIQNLGGLRDETGRVGVVAGGRRYRAIALLQDDPRFQSVPVKMAPDAETAAQWAASENYHHEPPHPADEIREYGQMAARGVAVPAIALAFGVSEAHVYRRLKLASLPAPVLEALKAGEITLQAASAFTISEDATHSLAVLDEVRGKGYSERQIKAMLKPHAIRQTDRRAVFVGMDAYQAAGGRIISDLFAEETYLDDAAILDDLFAAKLAEAAKCLRAEGWKWAEPVENSYLGYYEIEQRKLDRIYAQTGVLSADEATRYDELAELAEADALDDEGEAELAALQDILDGKWTKEQKALSGVLIYVSDGGVMQTAEGLVSREDRAAAVEAGLLRAARHLPDPEPKSPISQALRDDLARVVTGARQHAALRSPDLLIALLAFQLTGNMGHRPAFGLRIDTVANLPTTEAEGYALDPRLRTPDSPPTDQGKSDLGKGFRAFRKLGTDHMLAELTRYLASLLTGGDAAFRKLIDKEVAINVREVWTPTAANYWTRVAGSYRLQIWRDLLDLKADHPTATTFSKMKKVEQVDRLDKLFTEPAYREAQGVTEKQAARIAAWLPEGMA